MRRAGLRQLTTEGVFPTMDQAASRRPAARVSMRVAWADTDASGRIHNTAVFRWAEVAEHDLMRRAGITAVAGYVRRHVEATYHLPLRFDDAFDLALAVERVGNSSIVYAWRVERDGALCVEGRSVVVHVGAGEQPAPLPARLRALLEPFAPAGATP
jgi:YbgC/YbaW family acyl-CoA thioester hydrolase